MPLFGRDKQEPESLPEMGSFSTYADRLAYIGRELDATDCRSVAIVEVSGDFIVRTTDTSSNRLVLGEVVEDDFRAGKSSVGGLLQRSYYEPLLREVGHDLDERVAANVAVIERQRAFQVIGWMHGEAAGRATYVRFDRLYTFDQLNEQSGGNR